MSQATIATRHSTRRILRLAAAATLLTSGAAYGAGAATHQPAHAAAPHAISGPARQAMIRALGRAPLHFEPNIGQSAAGVQFLARGAGYGLYLTAGGATLALHSGSPARHLVGAHRAAQTRQSAVLQMQFLGANLAARGVGAERLPGVANYLVGNQPSQWRRGIPTFAQVRFANVYRGIDLRYYGTGSQLEYDFVLAPGADAARIQLRFGGATQLRLDRQGNLVVDLGHGKLIQHAPVLYQQGSHGRVAVGGHFQLQGNTVRIVTGVYDHSRALVIDPTLAYSTYLGGSSNDVAVGMAIDSAGNAYLTGETESANFPTKAPTGFTPLQIAPGSSEDAFVAKLQPGGNGAADLIYSTYLGGSGDDIGYAIAIDSSNNAYVTGQSKSVDFPKVNALPINGGQNNAVNGDIFVSKLDANGANLLYSTLLGGSGEDIGYAITIDSSNNAYVTGSTETPNADLAAPKSQSAAATAPIVKPLQITTSDFPTTAGAFQTTSSGETVFVSKLNPAAVGLASLVYSTFIGGVNGTIDTSSDGNAIVVDDAGNAYLTGATKDPNFPTTAGVFQRTFASGCLESDICGGSDAYVTELNPTGTNLVLSTFLGGSGSDEGNGIARDSLGNIYLAGETESHDFPVSLNAFQTKSHAPPDSSGDNGTSTAFVTKLNSSATFLLYSTYLGGSSGNDFGWSIAVDGTGAAYVAGDAGSTDFPVTPNALFSTNQGPFDVFVTKLAPSGRSLIFSTYLGGSNDDGSFDFGVGDPIAVDRLGRVYVAGGTDSTNFPTTTGAFQTANAGAPDAFLTVLGVSGCSVAGALVSGGANRVGVANIFPTLVGSTPNVSYLTAQIGIRTLVAPFPTFTCTVGTPPTITVTGTVRSGKGGVLAGDVATATITAPLGGPVTVTIGVTRGATVVIPPTTFTAVPAPRSSLNFFTF